MTHNSLSSDELITWSKVKKISLKQDEKLKKYIIYNFYNSDFDERLKIHYLLFVFRLTHNLKWSL